MEEEGSTAIRNGNDMRMIKKGEDQEAEEPEVFVEESCVQCAESPLGLKNG